MHPHTAVAIVDDHQAFAEALAGRLADEQDLTVVGTSSDAAGAWELLRQHRVDVLLLDLNLAGHDGLALCRDLRDVWPQLRVLVVTGARDESRLRETLQSGAAGWVDKCGSMDLMLNAIRAAALGQTSIPATALTRLMVTAPSPDTRRSSGEPGLLGLSQRERQVLSCLMAGATRKETAIRLHLAPNTVRTHVQSILHKLSVNTTVKAVAVARGAGLAPEPPHDASSRRRSAAAPDDRWRRGTSSVTSMPSHPHTPEGWTQQW